MSKNYCELTGMWKETKNALQKLTKDLSPTITAEVSEDGDLILDKIQGHIYSGDLGWTSLSPDTVRIKQGDDTILIETGTLANSFAVQKFKFSDGVNIFVGVPTNTPHPSGISADKLMFWIENGTSRMPARPLIAPTLEEVEKELPKRWKDVIQKFLRGL